MANSDMASSASIRIDRCAYLTKSLEEVEVSRNFENNTLCVFCDGDRIKLGYNSDIAINDDEDDDVAMVGCKIVD